MARISVIGLGKLGCPLAAVLSSKGHKVIGLDNNEETVRKVNLDRAPVEETGLQALMRQSPFRATTSYVEAVRRSDISFILVPTPSLPDGSFDNTHVLEAVRQIGLQLRGKKRSHLVVVCSTVMPGSTGGPISDMLDLAAEKAVPIAYSPEFIALGSVIDDMLNPDMILIGESSPEAGETLQKVLRTVSSAPVVRMNLVNAEIAKLSVNAYVTMKISYANQLAEICEGQLGADASVVLNAIGLDQRIGGKYLLPGPAFGGPCFPRDSRAFVALGNAVGVNCWLASATDAINTRQTERLVEIAKTTPAAKSPAPIVGILGLAYKADTAVTEESPGIQLARAFLEEGWQVRTYDPAVTASNYLPGTQVHSALALIDGCKLIYIMTDWPQFHTLFPAAFAENTMLTVVDCWGMIESGPWNESNLITIGQG